MEYVGRVPGCGWLAYIEEDKNGGVGNGGRSFSEKNEKWERKKKAEGGPALLGRREWQGILAWWMVGLLALSE